MRVLVTGGAGFIGANLCRRLVSQGASVTVVDDLSTGLASNLDGVAIDLVVDTILNEDLLNNIASSCDSVIHLAARGSVPRSIAEPLPTFEVNTRGTFNVLEAARLNKCQVISASSSSVFGANDLSPKIEATWTSPLSPYAASKLAGEAFTQAYARSYDLPITIFRFFNVFGPWQRSDHPYAAVIPKWVMRALRGEAIEVHGDGEQSRDFTYVDTVVDVVTRALKDRVSYPTPVNLAYGHSVSLNDILLLLSSLVQPMPAVIYSDPRPGDIRHSLNSPELVRQLFPQVEPVEFSVGFQRTLSWLNDLKIRGREHET